MNQMSGWSSIKISFETIRSLFVPLLFAPLLIFLDEQQKYTFIFDVTHTINKQIM